jgi:hypothetical protein
MLFIEFTNLILIININITYIYNEKRRYRNIISIFVIDIFSYIHKRVRYKEFKFIVSNIFSKIIKAFNFVITL